MKILVTFLSLLSIVSTAHADDNSIAGSTYQIYANGYSNGLTGYMKKCEAKDRVEQARMQTSVIPNATEVKVYLYTKDSSTMMGILAEDYFVFYRNEKKEPMFAKVAVTKASCAIVGLDLIKGYEIAEKK